MTQGPRVVRDAERHKKYHLRKKYASFPNTPLLPIRLYAVASHNTKYLVLCQEQKMHTLKLRSRGRIKKAKVTNVLDRLPGGVVMHFTPATGE